MSGPPVQRKATDPQLRCAEKADVEHYGNVVGWCIFCQEPVHEKDLTIWSRGSDIPLCCERRVPTEWRDAFLNEGQPAMSVYICLKAKRDCTLEFRKKREERLLCLSHGIVQKYANTLNSNSKVHEALQGKLKWSLRENETASVCSADEDDAEAQAAAEDGAAEDGAAAHEEAAPGNGEAEAQAGEEEGEEDNIRSDVSSEDLYPDPFAAKKSEDAAKAEDEAKKEAFKEDKLLTVRNYLFMSNLPDSDYDRIIFAELETPGYKLGVDDGAGSFVSEPWLVKISDDEEAREEEAIEKKNDTDLIKVAEEQAGAAQLAFPLASFTPWTPENIKLATTRMMDSINSKQGVHREDVLEMCSSDSDTYKSIWAENQGKHCRPWSPSLSNSVAVLAAHEDPPRADPHSPLACPRVLLSSKVVTRTGDSPDRSTRTR
jgi:hypothetical protein